MIAQYKCSHCTKYAYFDTGCCYDCFSADLALKSPVKNTEDIKRAAFAFEALADKRAFDAERWGAAK